MFINHTAKKSHRWHAFTVKAILLPWPRNWMEHDLKTSSNYFPLNWNQISHLFWSFVQQSKPISATDQLKAYLTELPAQWLDRYECTASSISLLYQHSSKSNSRKQRGTGRYTSHNKHRTSWIIPQYWGSCLTAGLEIPSLGESRNWPFLNLENNKHKTPSNTYIDEAI